MHQQYFLALTFALADASLVLKRDSESATPSANTISFTTTTSSSTTQSELPKLPNVEGLCFPRNATGQSDFTAPCNIARAIQAQCMYGTRILYYLNLPESHYHAKAPNFRSPEWQPESNETQRTCFCQSQYLDASYGCDACQQAHFGPNVQITRGPKESYDSFKEKFKGTWAKYCDADPKPEKSFRQFFVDEMPGYEDGEDDSPSALSNSSSSASFSSSLSSSTDVSLYYTMSNTASLAYFQAMPTPESSGPGISYTSSSTSGGQIVPTGSAGERQKSGDDDGSDGNGGDGDATETLSADSGAATAYAGGVGVLAVLDVFAAL